LPFAGLLDVLRQYHQLLDFWRRSAPGCPTRGHITVTGGEPLVRRDFWNLLELLSANRQKHSFAILTNGSRIDAASAKRLAKLGPAFVQVSIEGLQATHDEIRGRGNFAQTASAVRRLVRAGIHTLISFSAHGGNFREFPGVARLGRKLGVARVWADRVIPRGAACSLTENVLTPQETRELFLMMRQAQNEAARRWFGRTEVAMHRALQFLAGGGSPYHCTAGDSLITVQPNGDLYPCRRMPIRVGNLTETPLAELYYGAELFLALRNRRRVSEGCQSCLHARSCRGGLKCLSFAVNGDPFTADPGCWLASSRVVQHPSSPGNLTSGRRPSDAPLG
jgi:radical SAM protein with 4Fe4S-binding SPASM domain